MMRLHRIESNQIIKLVWVGTIDKFNNDPQVALFQKLKKENFDYSPTLTKKYCHLKCS